jgi:ABC-type transport system involved in cytochrome bd biosynthesis fused ATPase/permease subunit
LSGAFLLFFFGLAVGFWLVKHVSPPCDFWFMFGSMLLFFACVVFVVSTFFACYVLCLAFLSFLFALLFGIWLLVCCLVFGFVPAFFSPSYGSTNKERNAYKLKGEKKAGTNPNTKQHTRSQMPNKRANKKERKAKHKT